VAPDLKDRDMLKPLLIPLVAGIFLFSCARPEVTGRAIYRDFCVSCHGESGKGDGPAVAGLDAPPPDLTTLSARNNGMFPRNYVISTIDGYTRRASGGELVMPEFGTFLQAGQLVLLDTGDGIRTPTPERLVALAAYIETLQAP